VATWASAVVAGTAEAETISIKKKDRAFMTPQPVR
jgi:hypothetical protein